MPTTIFVYIKTSHFSYASKITFFKVFLLYQQQVIAYTSTILTYPFCITIYGQYFLQNSSPLEHAHDGY